MLARRRRFTITTVGRYETPTEIRIVHEIPKG